MEEIVNNASSGPISPDNHFQPTASGTDRKPKTTDHEFERADISS